MSIVINEFPVEVVESNKLPEICGDSTSSKGTIA